MTSQTSKALAYFPAEGDVRIIDLPVPSLEADEVLVRITRIAFSRRDRLLLESRDAVLPDGDEFIVPGHIAVGKVVEVGSMVKELEPGDLVVPTIRRDCGRCIDVCAKDVFHFGLRTNNKANTNHTNKFKHNSAQLNHSSGAEVL